jgi:hypothetical protein
MFVSTQISLELWIRLAYGSPLNDTHISTYLLMTQFSTTLNSTAPISTYLRMIQFSKTLLSTALISTHRAEITLQQVF